MYPIPFLWLGSGHALRLILASHPSERTRALLHQLMDTLYQVVHVGIGTDRRPVAPHLNYTTILRLRNLAALCLGPGLSADRRRGLLPPAAPGLH